MPAPVPHRQSEKEREKEIEAKRQEILRNVIKECPSYSFIKNSSVIKGFIKQLSVTNESVEDSVQTVLKEIKVLSVSLMNISKDATTLPILKTLEKLECPGRFMIDCSINGLKMKDALCDTGAMVNVMTQAVARRLGLSCYHIPKQPIILADSSKVATKGVVRDVMLQIGDCLVPTDFYIMDIDEDINRPLILGSSFLATVGAVMDYPNQRVSFSKINKTVFYPFYPIRGTSCTSIIHDEKPRPVLNDAPREVQKVIKGDTSTSKPCKKKRDRSSQKFDAIRIAIPKELRDMGDDVIKDKLQGTTALFPQFSSWQVQNGALVAKGRYGKFLFDPP